MLTSEQITALKNEIVNDPNSYGYAPLLARGSTGELIDMVNLIRPSINIPRTNVSPPEIRKRILVSEFVASQTILMGSWFESLMQSPDASISLKNPDGTNTNDLKNLKAMLVNNSASETAVITLAFRSGSRSEQLFGVMVTFPDMVAALALIG